MSNLKILPHVLCRVGGLSFDVLQQLHLSQQLQDSLNETTQLETTFETCKQTLLLDLKQFKPIHSAFSIIRKIKKKVYKNHLLNIDLIENLNDEPNQQTYNKLLIYNELINKIEISKASTKQQFESETIQHKTNLQELAKHPNFQNALPLSSILVAKRLENYLEKKPADFRKKELQIERTVLQYITRMAAKTSPFSSFTPLCYGKIDSFDSNVNSSISTLNNQKSDKKYRFTAFNSRLLQLFQAAFKDNPAITVFLNIRLNETLQITENHYRFLINVRNVEAFQVLEKQPILDLIEQLFITNKTQLTIHKTVDLLLEDIEAEQSEILSFVQELIEIGFLEIDFGYHGNTTNWLEKVTNFIKKTAVFDSDDFLLFQHLQQSLIEFGNTVEANNSMKNRIIILERLHQQIQTFFDKYNFEIDLQKALPPEQLIYEDVALDETLIFDKKAVKPLIDSLHQLLEQVNFITGKERLQIQYFFNEHYGENAVVSVLDFYESYYKFGKKIKETDILSIQKEAVLIKRWTTLVRELIQKKYNEGEDLELKIADFQLINKKLDISLIPLNQSSLACFAQVYEEDSTLKAVLNAATAGYGKMTGRFLNLMPSTFTNDLKDFNAHLSKKSATSSDFHKLIADNVDASFFNANHHPPLFDFEISMPESQNQLSQDQQLNVKDLAVRNINQQLVLWHQTKKVVVQVVDLGIQTPKGRSELYQLLMNFSPIVPSLQYLRQTIEQSIIEITKKSTVNTANNEIIIAFPAVNFKNWCIMREQWKIPNLGFLDKIRNFAPDEQYKIIRKWFTENNIDSTIYIKNTNFVLDKINQNSKSRKPTYFNFNNVILLNLLLKAMKDKNNIYNFTKLFPFDKKILNLHKERFFVECVFQWYI